nr:hypothetical protein [uncultured Flavobacterium sp.]
MSIAISEIQLYNASKTKLGNKQAEELVAFVKVKVENEIEEQSSKFSIKEDLLKLENKLAETKIDSIKWVFSFFIVIALMIIGLYLKKQLLVFCF